MQVSKGRIGAALTIAVLAGSATTAVTAIGRNGAHQQGHHRGVPLLAASLAPSVPGDPPIHGATPGMAPWVLRRGSVLLRRDGRLRVKIRGLVIPTAPANGTPGPVMTVSASLYCGDDTAAADTTPAVPISRGGDARIADRLDLPAKCLAPAVLVHPNDGATAYIAAGGFGG